MAGEAADRRARARRERQPNVAGGRSTRCVVKLSDAEAATLKARAESAGVTVPRLLVETTLGEQRAEPGRAAAVLAVLELDEQVRRIGNNLNQLARYAHQEQGLPEEIVAALRAVVQTCLTLDETARWVMGKPSAVTAVSLGGGLAVELPPDLDDGPGSWGDVIDG
ncbi:MobC family plasmid mobilization relaxosome protein [Nocardia sp. alder85J]|uniref:MobC family plasmid mobilization relaxosome protein n=1 Tax=Nocardia sp. alder85J TaxID=2862949 RepID=UPI001CD48236|nr:MobC family plasmid mobilization relaxosome protein [Nocardia sp. alder85J]MCX4099263.1 MobC family plasmid mobilization relaxosome protein [Nocardia sp. alder85J]